MFSDRLFHRKVFEAMQEFRVKNILFQDLVYLKN